MTTATEAHESEGDVADRREGLEGLFSEVWYHHANPDTAAAGSDLLEHYLRHGSREGQRPNPWFQPEWYRARYPDVEAAGVEPLQHYAEHGWREGRDPSAAFSTTYYLTQNPDVAASGMNPLLHYLRHGQAEGRRPHPLLSSLDLARPRVGIIVDAVHTGRGLGATMDSLGRACTQINAEVVVAVGGATASAVRAICQDPTLSDVAFGVDVFEAPEAAGCVGAVALAMRTCEARGATHFFLLGAGDVVPANALARLLELCEPVVCPVSGTGDSDQNVPLTLPAGADGNLVAKVEALAELRREGWNGRPKDARRLGAVGLLVRTDVAQQAGYLDTQFETMAAACADLGWRLTANGYRPVISRAVLVHASDVARGAREVAEEAADEERLHRRHGLALVGRTEAWIASWTQDWANLREVVPGSPTQVLQKCILNEHVERCARLGTVAARTAGQTPELVRRLAIRDAQVAALWQQSAADIPPLHGGGEPSDDLTYARLIDLYLDELRSAGLLTFANALAWRDAIVELALALSHEVPLIVLCNNDPFGPVGKDGYQSRVMMVDAILTSSPRIYVHVDASKDARSVLSSRGHNLWVLTLRKQDATGMALLRTLAGISRIIVHSIFPLFDEFVRAALNGREPFAMIDLHGAVPEELRLYDDPYRAQAATRIEADVWRTFGRVVCVSRAMADHLTVKHGQPQTEPLVCPVTPAIAERPARGPGIRREHPLAIYVGGAQRWQQPERIVEAIVATGEWCDHIVLTPDVEAFDRLFAARGCRPELLGVTIETASSDEVLDRLEQSDFGLILRDSSIINKVSCPTKLIEYLHCDVIPVLDSSAIGDFAGLGLAYVPLAAFIHRALPGTDERTDMVRRNRAVLSSLRVMSRKGFAQMSDWALKPAAPEEDAVR